MESEKAAVIRIPLPSPEIERRLRLEIHTWGRRGQWQRRPWEDVCHVSELEQAEES